MVEFRVDFVSCVRWHFRSYFGTIYLGIYIADLTMLSRQMISFLTLSFVILCLMELSQQARVRVKNKGARVNGELKFCVLLNTLKSVASIFIYPHLSSSSIYGSSNETYSALISSGRLKRSRLPDNFLNQ